jgi:hypothetical protein
MLQSSSVCLHIFLSFLFKRSSVIKKLHVETGSSLMTAERIAEFENEEDNDNDRNV